MAATPDVTENPMPATVNFRSPIVPAPVPLGLAAGPTPATPRAVATAPVPFVLPKLVENEVEEPTLADRPSPIKHVRFSDSFCPDFLPCENVQSTRWPSKTLLRFAQLDRRLTTEAILNDRQPLRRRLPKNLHPFNFCELVLNPKELSHKVHVLNQL